MLLNEWDFQWPKILKGVTIFLASALNESDSAHSYNSFIKQKYEDVYYLKIDLHWAYFRHFFFFLIFSKETLILVMVRYRHRFMFSTFGPGCCPSPEGSRERGRMCVIMKFTFLICLEFVFNLTKMYWHFSNSFYPMTF